ncbi:MAG: hypothetical protein O3A21_04145, partial [Proteobacteria bacterium]|nr:hypothetical protein [Pseudomonadota bacterium]
KQDFAKAAEWYLKAAELGLARAQANLANMYLRGQGVDKNATEAARWFSASAKQGHTISQYNLGLIYEHGLGIDADDVEAVRWYYLASKSGHAKALSKLALLIAKNAPPELARLITGEEASTQTAANTPAKSKPREVAAVTSTDEQQESPAPPPPSEASAANPSATATTTHSAALPPKQPLQLAELPRPDLPPTGSGRVTPVNPPVSDKTPADNALAAGQAGGIFTTLKSLFSASQPTQSSTDDEAVRVNSAMETAARADEPVTGSVQPIAVVPVSSILDAGLIAYRARDYRTALTNWLPLAQNGNENAQFFIGGLYADGAGVQRDVVRAHVWWSLAAASGHGTATKFLENLKLEMEPDQVVAAGLFGEDLRQNVPKLTQIPHISFLAVARIGAIRALQTAASIVP